MSGIVFVILGYGDRIVIDDCRDIFVMSGNGYAWWRLISLDLFEVI